MDKRGISPLIATVLIVGFTIVLAVLVIAWLSGVFSTKLSTEECTLKAQEFCASLNVLLDVSAANDATTTTATVAYLGTGTAPVTRVAFLDVNGVTKAIETVTWTNEIGTATYAGIDATRVQAFVSTTPSVPGVVCSETACAPVAADVL